MAAPNLQQIIAAALSVAQTELQRIQQDATAKTAAVNARIVALQNAQATATPEMQTLLDGLASVGVNVSFGG